VPRFARASLLTGPCPFLQSGACDRCRRQTRRSRPRPFDRLRDTSPHAPHFCRSLPSPDAFDRLRDYRPPTPCRRSTLSPIRELYTNLAPIGRLLKNGKASVAVPCGVRGGRGRRPCRPRTHCLPFEVAAFALRQACGRTPRRTVALPPNLQQGAPPPAPLAGASLTPRTPRCWRSAERTLTGIRQRSAPVKRKSRHNSAALRPCGHLFRFSA
jgi:hypothetical protein